VEIEDDGLVAARRHMPGDHALAVRRLQLDFLRLRQAGFGRCRPKPLGEVLHRALGEIEQRQQPAVADESDDQDRFQHDT
jgi:hypothetical protein